MFKAWICLNLMGIIDVNFEFGLGRDAARWRLTPAQQ